MKIQIGNIGLIFFSILFISVSCAKEDRNNTIIDQEKSIDTYISGLSDVTVIRKGGSNRLIVLAGAGDDSLAFGDSVYFYYSAYTFSSGKGTLFATNDTIVAKANGFSASGEPYAAKLGVTDMVSGLKNGMLGMKKNENSNIVFSAKYGFNNSVVYNVPKLTPLFYDITVTKIIKN